MPIDEWPEAINRSFDHMNPNVYVYMQGPSEFGITGDASLKDWDVTAQLKTLTVPTLVIGAKHDTMDPNIWNGCLKKFKTGTFYCAQMEVILHNTMIKNLF
jgi:proline iminopeptidase